ncbi:hypothetical protein F4781DRAFT_377449 [Annulohypoxylon bovei var. microspora]|nr:hypothetical protein F4781DRAFT_377449 [Annulohypoxylon bovei var. microspora]
MSPRLRPLQLPLLVEERRKREEEEAAQREAEVDVPYNFYTTDSYSSDATSPATPTFSARGHLRCSSSTSSFDLTTVASSDSSSSPTQTAQGSGKRALPDVEEEPIECGDEFEDSDTDYDDASELYHCLCDEPCIHRDTDLVQSASNFYTDSRGADYDAGFFSDGEFSFSLRSSLKRRRDGSESPFAGLSQRLGSRFPSFTKWKSSKPSSISSPVSDYGFEQPFLSRAPSSRSSSVSASGRRRQDRQSEPPAPLTPALSRNGSSDRMPLDATADARRATELLFAIQHERRQAATPLLPPMTASPSAEHILSQPSPLESPSVACAPSLFEEEIYSTGMISPPLSAKASSSSSLRLVPGSVELPQLPAPDAWSDRLGHANYTIVPKPYVPETADLRSLRLLRSDWEAARVNYTKHLARTGEHYGQTSKTYALTEAKWSETQRDWRDFHDETAEKVVASGEATACEKFDGGMLTTVPRMDAEGKFPERGDEDIVGPMVREATMMSLDGADRKGPGFWRNLAGKVGLRK